MSEQNCMESRSLLPSYDAHLIYETATLNETTEGTALTTASDPTPVYFAIPSLNSDECSRNDWIPSENDQHVIPSTPNCGDSAVTSKHSSTIEPVSPNRSQSHGLLSRNGPIARRIREVIPLGRIPAEHSGMSNTPRPACSLVGCLTLVFVSVLLCVAGCFILILSDCNNPSDYIILVFVVGCVGPILVWFVCCRRRRQTPPQMSRAEGVPPQITSAGGVRSSAPATRIIRIRGVRLK